MEFIDLRAQYSLIKASIKSRIDTVLEHGKFIMGPEVEELESRLGQFTGTKHCITCSNGTDALLMPLMAYGIGPGDAIFTTPFTFIATAEVIALTGATPVFVDIDEHTFNIDPQQLEDAIVSLKKGTIVSEGTPAGLRPRGIIPVDLFGLPAEYDTINQLAKKHGLFVLEDAAQSFGGSYKQRRTCSLADVASTSFFPAKPLGCYGDGGAIFTNDDTLAEGMRSIRIHGKGSNKYDNVRIGLNGRLDTLQAAIVLAKMDIFEDEIDARQKVAGRYSASLKNVIQTPVIPAGSISAWAQYSLVHSKRESIMKSLQLKGIPSMVYYPKPLHLQKAFAYLKYTQGSFPISERISQTIFSLPMHPYLGEQQQEETISGVSKAINEIQTQ
jgi:UDP-2-acetamido-2-deoxy-ribo-hexuluronate aminotransferase